MAVTVTPASAFVAPLMAAEPLLTALQNLAEVYQYHCPAILSVCPTAPTDVRPPYFVMPIKPSADGLPYTVRLIFVTPANDLADVDVWYTTDYTGDTTTWTHLDGDTGLATVEDEATVWEGGGVIPADAEAIKVFADADESNLVLHHVLVAPNWDAIDPPAGVTDCGFVAFDDTMITGTGAPIHTEHVNRCKLSALAVLRDRWQCAYSYCAQGSGTTDYQASVAVIVGTPAVRLWLPYQGPDVTLHVAVIADVSGGGSTSGLVRLAQVNVEQLDWEAGWLDADTGVQIGTLQVKLQGEPAARYADLQMQVKGNGTGTTRVRSVIAWWQPGE